MVPRAHGGDTAQNVSDYSNGLKSWTDFLLRKHEIELKYFTDREEVYKRFKSHRGRGLSGVAEEESRL